MHPDWKKIDTIDELIARMIDNVCLGYPYDGKEAARSDLADVIDRAIEIKRATVAVEMAKRILELEQLLDEKQAQIDRLMLEFCPEEMTPEQIDEWGKNQKVSDV